MARPRMFDEERALDAAMHAFWVNGYEATSTQDLCEATGLGRSSIYNTFTSKHELFLRALARYTASMTGAQLDILGEVERSPLERIEVLFGKVIEQECEGRQDGRSIGCLTVNTTVELSARDPEVESLLVRDLEVRLAALRAVIEEGRRTGDVTDDRDPAALAGFLNAVIGGMRVSGRGGADRATLEAIAATALDALRSR